MSRICWLEDRDVRALAIYEEAVALLQGGGYPADADLAAAQRGREAALRQRGSAA